MKEKDIRIIAQHRSRAIHSELDTEAVLYFRGTKFYQERLDMSHAGASYLGGLAEECFSPRFFFPDQPRRIAE